MSSVARGRTSRRDRTRERGRQIPLHAHHFDDDALSALSIELRIEQLFPRSEIEFAVRNRHHDLMAHDRAFQMRVGIVFAGLVMPVVEARGRELLQPHLKVADQTVFPVVHIHSGGDVHRRHEHRSVFDAARVHDRRDFIRDADELLTFFRVEPEIVGVDLHSARAASALRSDGANTPARSLRSPAAAIIAALSVDNARLGRNVGISRCSPWYVRSLRSRLLADTPPATPMLLAPNRRAASNVRSTSVVTTVRWKLAQTSATSRSLIGPAPLRSRSRTWRSTAVFSPLKLKSRSPFKCGALRS